MARREVELAKLFYTLEARTQGLHRGIDEAEKSLGRLASFIKAHPIAALGALGAAAVAVGLKAAEMASQFEGSMRRIAAVIPGGTQALQQISSTVETLAQRTGKSVEELTQAGQAIARAGVSGPQEFADRLALVSKVADATATDMGTVARDIDTVLDVFGLSADKAEEVAAKLVAAGKGKFEWEQLTAAIQAVAPAVQDAGLGFEEAVAFLAHWVEQGRTAKQSAKELKDELKDELAGKGVAALQEVAGAATSTADAIRELDKAADFVAKGADRIAGQLSERWHSRMREIGSAINEFAIKPLQQLLLILSDPFFAEKPGQGFLEGSILTVLSQPGVIAARQKAANAAALAAVTGPAVLPELTVTALTPAEQEQLRSRAEAFARDVRAALVKATAALADDLQLVLEEFRKRYNDVYDGLTEQERRLANERLRQLENQLRLIRQFEGEAPLTPQVKQTTDAAPQTRKLTAEQIAAAQKEITKNLERQAQADKEALAAERERLLKLYASANEIERGVRGAANMGKAFGIIDDQVAGMLSGLADVAGSLKLIAGGAGGLGTWLGLLGGFTALAGGAFGGGAPAPSALDAESQRIQKANTEAILSLTRVIGEWGADITGNVAEGALAAIAELRSWISTPGRFNQITTKNWSGKLDFEKLDEFLQQFGLSWEEFKAAADEIGFELDTSSLDAFLASIIQLQEALQNTQLTEFSDTFEGQLRALRLQFELFDISDPIAQIKALQNLIENGPDSSSALQGITAGLDLGTPGGRAEADRRIRELFERIAAGDLKRSELGGLTSQQLEDMLRELEQLLDTIAQQQGEQTGGAPTQTSFGRESAITEATGSQITGLLLSHDIKLGQLVEYAASILAQLTELVLPPTLAFSGGAGLVVTFEVNVNGALPPAEAQATGQLVGLRAADILNSKLGALLRSGSVASGDNGVAG